MGFWMLPIALLAISLAMTTKESRAKADANIARFNPIFIGVIIFGVAFWAWALLAPPYKP